MIMANFSLADIQQAVIETEITPNSRSARLVINDFMDSHPALRAQLVEIAFNRDKYRRVYDQQRHMEEVVMKFDKEEGNQLIKMDITPSQLIEYAKDRVNKYAKKAGVRILRGRVVPLQITDQSTPAEPEDKGELDPIEGGLFM